MKKFMVLALVLALMGVSVLTVWAGMHFVGGVNTFGGSIHAQGTVAGLGNNVGTVVLTGSGELTALCQNKGGKVAPGQNPVYASASTSANAYPGADGNGSEYVSLSVHEASVIAAAGGVNAKQAGCPNGNWSVVGFSFDRWTSASVQLFDQNGGLVEQNNYTCSGSYSDTKCW